MQTGRLGCNGVSNMHGPIDGSSVASRSQTLGGIVRARINRQQARTSLSLRLQVGLVLSRPRLSSV